MDGTHHRCGRPSAHTLSHNTTACHERQSACRPNRHNAHHPIGTGAQPLPERCIPTTLLGVGTQSQCSTVPNYSEKYPGSYPRQLLRTNCSGTPIRSTTTPQQSTAVHHLLLSRGSNQYNSLCLLCQPFGSAHAIVQFTCQR